MNRFVLGIVLLILTCSLYSCSFRKLVAGKKPEVYVWHVEHNNVDSNGVAKAAPPVLPQPYNENNQAENKATEKPLVEQLTPMWKKRLQYRTFSGKARMKMEAPDDKQDFTAHFRIRKDSVIWVNITALGGFTFARILITRDSFFMINPIQKTAICVPLDKAAKILPSKVDFTSLQRLIMGEPLRDGTITDAADMGDKWTIRVEDTSYIQEVSYSKSDSGMVSSQLLTHNPAGPRALTQYSNYEVSDRRKISTGRVLNLHNGNDEYTLEMNFLKTSFDEDLEFPFSIPGSYEIKPVAP